VTVENNMLWVFNIDYSWLWVYVIMIGYGFFFVFYECDVTLFISYLHCIMVLYNGIIVCDDSRTHFSFCHKTFTSQGIGSLSERPMGTSKAGALSAHGRLLDGRARRSVFVAPLSQRQRQTGENRREGENRKSL
jgi:hypothetical protein